jgi:hypothetical protein
MVLVVVSDCGGSWIQEIDDWRTGRGIAVLLVYVDDLIVIGDDV